MRPIFGRSDYVGHDVLKKNYDFHQMHTWFHAQLAQKNLEWFLM